MNKHVRITPPDPGSEGPRRWRWTVDDLDRMVEVGLLSREDRVELIDGEIVPMAAKGNRHENVRHELSDWLHSNRPADVAIAVELGWRPEPHVYLEPDLLLFARGPKAPTLAPALVLLAIEIADSSKSYDLGTKAETYAKLGVREYWVVEAWSLVTHVHREPGPTGYASRTEVKRDDLLVPTLVEGMALRLGELAME